jgi:hypothetical protein
MLLKFTKFNFAIMLFKRYKKYVPILIAIVLVGTTSCKKDIKADEALQDSLAAHKEAPMPKIDTFPKINYHLINFTSNSRKKHFLDSLSNVPNFSQHILMTLNRKDWNYILSSKEILVPEKFVNDIRAYSFFPLLYPGARHLKKLIIMSAHYQGVAFYEYGVLIRFAAVNSGKEKTQTYPGRYALTFKQLERHSSIDSNWVMKYYFNFHPEAGMAFHQFTMPGYPASHSCSRMFEEDAIWLYSWGERAKLDSSKHRIPLSGTPVIILDHYPFGIEYRPWMQFKSNKDIILDLPNNPMKVEEPLIPISQIPEDVRGMLRNRERFIIAEDSLRKLGIIRPGVEITKSVNFNKLRRIKKALELKKKKEMLKTQPEKEDDF